MAQKQQLVRRGARDLDLTLAVRSGSVARARQGWYTTLPQGDPRVRAVRVGGRLTGISAIRAMGGWVLGAHPLHVSVPANAARLRTEGNRFLRLTDVTRTSEIVHWDAFDVGERGSALIVGLSDALLRVVLDESVETAVAAIDWARRTGRLDDCDFERLVIQLPIARRWVARMSDPRCDSLPESLVRTRARLAGHVVISQVRVGDIDQFDLLIDGCAAIEVDGDQFHRHRFEHDRRKDIAITRTGLHVIRPSARMVFYEWDAVYAAILSALDARGARRNLGNSGLDGRARPRRRVNSRVVARPAPPFPEFPKGDGGARGSQGRAGLRSDKIKPDR